METPDKTYIVQTETTNDGSEDVIVPIPQEVMDYLGIEVGDEVTIEAAIVDGEPVIRIIPIQ